MCAALVPFGQGNALRLYSVHSQLTNEETEAENRKLLYLLRPAMARSQHQNCSHLSFCSYWHWFIHPFTHSCTHLFLCQIIPSIYTYWYSTEGTIRIANLLCLDGI